MQSKRNMLEQILAVVTNLKQEMKTMATSQAQLDAAIAALGTAVTNEDSLLANLITAVNTLVADVKAGASPVDLTTEATAISSMASDITNQAANIQAALTTAGTVTTPPATPPAAS